MILDAISFHFHNLSPFAFSPMISSSASFILASFQNSTNCFSSSIPGSLAQPRLQAEAVYPEEGAVITRHLEALWHIRDAQAKLHCKQVQRQLNPSLELCALALPVANSINPGRWKFHNLISQS